MADEVLCQYVVWEIVMLRRITDVGPQFRSCGRGVLAENSKRAAVGAMKGQQHAEQRRFARTVRTEQPGHSGRHVCGDIGEHLMRAPRLRHCLS